jgi:hypothetical protein
MSVVQVFYHDKMSAIAHLIASDQLPLPTQVRQVFFLYQPLDYIHVLFSLEFIM